MKNIIKNSKDKITVVLPVYNEQKVIKKVIEDYYTLVIKKLPGSRLIVLEDGSTDNTRTILKDLNKKLPFSLTSAKQRKGYTKAFKDALNSAKTKWVFFSDSDAQHDPVDIFKMIGHTGKYDIVGGYKYPRKDPFYRIAISRILNLFIYILFGLRIKDINSGFKLIKKEVINNILPRVGQFKYCIMIEFILKAYLSGYKIKEVPVKHLSRDNHGSNIFSAKEMPFICAGLVRNILKIKFRFNKGTK